jgi:DnaJ-class molecular chaperone
MRDPYEVLGVTKGTDIKEVKKAYRKLARQLHPDLHPGDTKAENRFKEVSSAHQFLSNADQKARYDRGEIDASGAPRAERTFYRTYAEGRPGSRYSDPQEVFKDLDGTDIFADLFRGVRHNAAWQAEQMRHADTRHKLEIDLLDAANGAVREIVLPGGKRLKVTIPPGASDGQVLRLRGQAAQGPTQGTGGGRAGDVLIELEVRPHPTFSRKGNDIHAELPVTLPEAVLGAKIEVPTVAGNVTLTVPTGANTGTRLRVKGKGAMVPGGRSRGDHYVTFKVMLPDKPDPELVELVEKWASRHPYRVRGGR